MKRYIQSLFLLVVLSSCSNEIRFENKEFSKKSNLLCKENCPEIKVSIPYATNNSTSADSINKKVFSRIKELVYLDEKPLESEDYQVLLSSFINSYETTKEEIPDATFGWEAAIEGTVKYQSEQLINIEIDHYTFTGGAVRRAPGHRRRRSGCQYDLPGVDSAAKRVDRLSVLVECVGLRNGRAQLAGGECGCKLGDIFTSGRSHEGNRLEASREGCPE